MPTMKRDSTLRSEPGGALFPVIGTEGAPIDILGTTQITVLNAKQDWTKIKLVDADEPSEGWVPADRVNDAGVVAGGPIDEVKFVRQCWLESLIADVTPQYVVAVAQLRSSRSQAVVKEGVGPFGFTQKEWNDYCTDPELGVTNYGSVDIFDWRRQSVLFSAITARLETRLTDGINGPPSVSQLFLAQMVGSSAASTLVKSPLSTVTDTLAATPNKDLPPGFLTREQLVDRFAPLLGTAAQPATGKDALGLIDAAMQPVLDATRQVVDDVGREYLGLIPHDGIVDKAGDPVAAKVTPPRVCQAVTAS